MEFNGTPEEWDALVKRNKMRQEKWDNLHKELDDALEEEFGSEEPKQETLTYTEAAKKEERIFNSTMMSKQETLEEAAANLADPNLCKTDNWIAGANWMAERMYSEEDLREAFRQGENNVGYNGKYGYTFKLTEKEWFEQFKKK
jgi:hypothetical protein